MQIELGETFNVNEGEIIYDEVEEGMYKYFLYYNPNEEPFTVSVTTFADEKPIVYINKG